VSDVPPTASFLSDGMFFVCLWISLECQSRIDINEAAQKFTRAFQYIAPKQRLLRKSILSSEGEFFLLLIIVLRAGHFLFNSSIGSVGLAILGNVVLVVCIPKHYCLKTALSSFAASVRFQRGTLFAKCVGG
jgi:hypothetical protein